MVTLDYKGWTLFEAIDALMAYDQGVTDSGVNDGLLREAVKQRLERMTEDEFRVACAKVASRYLTDEAISQGYGLAEVRSFIRWLSTEMQMDV